MGLNKRGGERERGERGSRVRRKRRKGGRRKRRKRSGRRKKNEKKKDVKKKKKTCDCFANDEVISSNETIRD